MGLTCFFLGHRWQSQRCTRCDAWRTPAVAKKQAVVVHQLKVWPQYLDAILLHGKRFEVRRTDRPFAVGDKLLLRGWDPMEQAYTGHSCTCTITYILPGDQFGIEKGYAVLGFKLHTFSHHPTITPDVLPNHF
ncbi:MAG: DUF3850 domain-containing protein [Bacteroidetes bacterium]|nr:DUF3850 domain-containing protein [Bacteroidota bacterium]MBS1944714.1 DUF3850 domain-containing protein [Bacteroidota bacterium]